METTISQRASVGTAGFLEPDKVVREFGLKVGDHVADFGAGHGYFTIPIAKIVGGDGKVYAIDIQKSVLDVIRSRARLEHILNIETVWSDLDQAGGSRLKDGYIDAVIIANILFQAEEKQITIKEAARILRPEGKLIIIDWVFEVNQSFGPPKELRITKEEIKHWAMQTGLSFEREFDAGTHHFGLIFKKT